jgi:hypothetical protein
MVLCVWECETRVVHAAKLKERLIGFLGPAGSATAARNESYSPTRE